MANEKSSSLRQIFSFDTENFYVRQIDNTKALVLKIDAKNKVCFDIYDSRIADFLCKDIAINLPVMTIHRVAASKLGERGVLISLENAIGGGAVVGVALRETAQAD